MKERMVAQDMSFGGALKRLRVQKGLKRSDFAPLPAKPSPALSGARSTVLKTRRSNRLRRSLGLS